MKTALGWLGLFAMGACLFAGTAGCETACTEDERTNGTTCTAKSLTRFDGTAFDKSAAYTAGNDITITGVFGEITVIQGVADNVKVTFQPFSYRAHDGELDAKRDMEEALKTDVAADAAGAVTVKSWREGEFGSSLGAGMTVELPANFNGKLWILNEGKGDVSTNDAFNVTADYVASAIALDVQTGSDLGECRIQGAPTVTNSFVHCGSFVKLLNVSDNVDIQTTFGANTDDAVQLAIASISSTATGGSIKTEDGTVAATFPAAGNYAIQASTTEGTVSADPAEGCVHTEADPPDPRVKTITCGTGGPVYSINAGLDSLGDSNINLKFL